MPKILVPIDFSATSLNAAIYAGHFGKIINASKITFLSVVSESIIGADGTPIAGGTDERDLAIKTKLEELQVSIYEMTGVPTSIDLEAGDFPEIVARHLERHLFDLMIIGISGSNALEQVFGTSNAVEVIARTATPVLVVPPDANFKSIKKLGIAVELHNMDEMIPLKNLDKWLHWMNARVYLAHVNESFSNEISEQEKNELNNLKDKLILFEPVECLLEGESFTDALNDMAQEKNIDLLITFPQRHSFFNLLFRNSHTKKLVFHSNVPVLALPQSLS